MQKLKNAGLYLFSFLLLFISLEVVSFFYLSYSSKGIYSPGHYYKIMNVGLHSGNCTWGDKIAHHPYLSLRYHRQKTCNQSNVNQRGMMGNEIPQSKDPNYYNVMILGGSVAELLFSSEELEKYLNSNFQSPNKKAFKIWNGSISAGQQPRQAITHLLLGEAADLVISLEGFNEHFSYASKSSLEAPPHAWYEIESLRFEENKRTRLLRPNQIKRISLKAEKNPIFRNSFLSVTILSLAYQVSNRKDSTTEIEKIVPESNGSSEKIQNEHIQAYSNYLFGMGSLAKARKQNLVVFLQPVPALFKSLTDADKKAAQDLSYGKSYQQMVNKLIGHPGHKVKIISILDTFSKYDGDLYVDLIHFRSDSKGNQWLARRISTELGTLYGWKNKT